MKKKKLYRIYFWTLLFSAVVLSAVLAYTSYRILQADSKFSRLILEENKQFLINTLRSTHRMMMRMEGFRYDSIIDLALKSRFITFLALLDERGRVVYQSRAVPGIPPVDHYDPKELSDGRVLQKTHNSVLISFKAPKDPIDKMPPRHRMMQLDQMGESALTNWYVVAIDTSVFHQHYHDTLVQTLAAAGAVFLLGVLIIVFMGIVQRYELAHLSLERLTKIKRALANFVPTTARDLIESNPDLAVMDKVIEDATVLFIDIEGFTHLVHRYPLEVINRNIESYFSCFYEFIQSHSGDINETAGDGMMVIFHHPDPVQHALNAVNAAKKIHMSCLGAAGAQSVEDHIPLIVNMGVSSGHVHLGSTKIHASAGDRWTFTASGPVTVLAARLCQYAQGGQILLSSETAKRVSENFAIQSLGQVSLKNLQEPVEVFQLQ